MPVSQSMNDGEMMDAISRISDEPNTIFENRV